MTGLCDIPHELIAVILLEWLPPKWRFCVRPVCAQWKRILDRDGDESRDVPANERADRRLWGKDRLVPWGRISRLNYRRDTANHKLRCMWRRGSVVLASVAASWCAARFAAERASPQFLVDWCMTTAANGIEPAMVAVVLVATNVPALARHAIEILLPTIGLDEKDDKEEEEKGTDGGCDDDLGRYWYSKHQTNYGSWTRKWDVHHFLMCRLSRTGDLGTIRALLPHLNAIDWARVTGITYLINNAHSDVVRFFLEQWIAAGTHHKIGAVWSSSKHYAVQSLLALMGAPSPDLFFVGLCFGKNDWDHEFGLASDHSLQEEQNRSLGVGAKREQGRDPLSKRLLASWKGKGCQSCAIDAAMEGRLSVLEMIEPYMPKALKKKVFRAACSCAQTKVVEWCLRSWSRVSDMGVTVHEALRLATRPYVDDDGYRHAKDPASFLEWIFDPKGGAYVATLDEIRQLFTDGTDRACAFWFAEKRTKDVVALGPPVMRAFVKHACSGNRSWHASYAFTAGTLERVVRVLDHYAAVASACGTAPFECDLWAILTDVVRKRSIWNHDSRTYDPVRYAWKRVTGREDAAFARSNVRSSKQSSIESWRRWCRPVPIAVTQFWSQTNGAGAKRNAGNMMCWLASKDLLITDTTDPVNLATLASTAPDQEDNDYGDTEWSERRVRAQQVLCRDLGGTEA